MSAKAFTHPNFGREVRVEQNGKEVSLTFVAASNGLASDLLEEILRQLKLGALNITLMGKPTSIQEG